MMSAKVTTIRSNPTPEELFQKLKSTPTDMLFFRSEEELKIYRSRIYSLNSENASFRVRTMREGRTLVVWKMNKGTIA